MGNRSVGVGKREKTARREGEPWYKFSEVILRYQNKPHTGSPAQDEGNSRGRLDMPEVIAGVLRMDTKGKGAARDPIRSRAKKKKKRSDHGRPLRE